MTKLLHLSDLHANKRWYQWVADHAKDYDLIAYAGDFLDLFGKESLDSQARWITAWARALPVPMMWAPGNHDVEIEWMASLPGATAVGLSGGAGGSEQHYVQVEWKGAIPELDAGDIVLAHAPPAGCLTATPDGGWTDRGDLDLSDALRSAAAPPRVVLSGHVHNPARWKDRCGRTVSLNPGMTRGAKVPNYISLDTTTGKARWFRDGELADVCVV